MDPAQSAALNAAKAHAEQAASIAATFKPGGWDSAKVAALISIAHSLAIIAENSTRRD
jgi:hypothetical protein